MFLEGQVGRVTIRAIGRYYKDAFRASRTGEVCLNSLLGDKSHYGSGD